MLLYTNQLTSCPGNPIRPGLPGAPEEPRSPRSPYIGIYKLNIILKRIDCHMAGILQIYIKFSVLTALLVCETYFTNGPL
jgi:hypothetical protein